MKKILALVLAVCMVLALAACGNSSQNESSAIKPFIRSPFIVRARVTAPKQKAPLRRPPSKSYGAATRALTLPPSGEGSDMLGVL